MLVAFDRDAEPLLEILGRGSRARSPASGLRRRRPSSRGRAPRSPRASPAAPPSRRAYGGGGRASGPELAQRQDREGVGPGERRGRAGDAGAGVDPLREQAGGRGGAAQVGQQAQCRRGARRGRRGSRRSRRSAPSRDRSSGQSSEGVIPKRPLPATSRSRVRARGREEAGLRERPHRPGRRRVEPGARLPGLRGPSPRRSVANCTQRAPAAWRRRRRRARCRGSRRGLSPGSRRGPASEACGSVRASPTARAAAADPAGGVALGGAAIDRLPGAVEARRGVEVEAARGSATTRPRLGAVAGGGEGDRDGRRVARPDVGPAVAGAGDAAPLRRSVRARRTSSERRVHPPRPAAGRPAAERAGRGRASAGRRRAADRIPPSRSDARSSVRRAEPGDRPQHVGPGQVALADAVGAPERKPARRSGRARGDDPGVGRHRARRPGARRDVDQRPPGRAEPAKVDDVAVGVDRPDGPPSPRSAVARNGGGMPGKRRRRRGSAGEPPETGERRDDDARPGQGCRRVRASPNAISRSARRSLAFPSAPPPRRPGRGSSVGRAHD